MAERDEVLGMKVIILDRDNQKLEFLKTAVLKARPDASVRLFQDTDRLLEAVRDLVPDVAFLRIEMEPLNGIILGRVLSGMFPKLNLIFMADSNQYAADAIKLRPSGYLSEPITEEIIGEELSRRGIALPEDIAPVMKRVIHTTADFEYLDTLTFTRDAVDLGVRALLDGTPIVTDTNMAFAGVNKKALEKWGGEALCFMADPDVAAEAVKRGVTRAAVSMEKAAREAPGCIYAVGNAPTALLELIRQMERGFRPALIIGVPVGFVNVVEAKEKTLAVCRKRNVPAIVALGRKGGSTVAAAICNALIYRAADQKEP